jgi:L,D-peptidoglycan transpeptidase YkuD (ErfK/YbiS/YcfS/YnhG family)
MTTTNMSLIGDWGKSHSNMDATPVKLRFIRTFISKAFNMAFRSDSMYLPTPIAQYRLAKWYGSISQCRTGLPMLELARIGIGCFTWIARPNPYGHVVLSEAP